MTTNPDSVASGPEPTRVLIADDHMDAADSLGMLLQILGYNVRHAYDGNEALAVGEEFRPQVALIDIGMPGKNGYEVAREWRAKDWGKETLLMALTGWGQAEQRKLTAEAGFDQHLLKPIHPTAIKKLIDEHVK